MVGKTEAQLTRAGVSYEVGVADYREVRYGVGVGWHCSVWRAVLFRLYRGALNVVATSMRNGVGIEGVGCTALRTTMPSENGFDACTIVGCVLGCLLVFAWGLVASSDAHRRLCPNVYGRSSDPYLTSGVTLDMHPAL